MMSLIHCIPIGRLNDTKLPQGNSLICDHEGGGYKRLPVKQTCRKNMLLLVSVMSKYHNFHISVTPNYEMVVLRFSDLL